MASCFRLRLMALRQQQAPLAYRLDDRSISFYNHIRLALVAKSAHRSINADAFSFLIPTDIQLYPSTLLGELLNRRLHRGDRWLQLRLLCDKLSQLIALPPH